MDATEALTAHTAGDAKATSRLLEMLYKQLRALAGSYMSREAVDHTLQPTALVHEAYLRLIDNTRVDWQGKTHFFALAAIEMRRVLVDHARRRGAGKRGANAPTVTLGEASGMAPEVSLDLLSVHEALEKLERLNPRQSRVVELRFFGGMNVRETAHVLDVSERTVKQDWRVSKAWLKRELGRES